MRGTALGWNLLYPKCRITPAHAGNSRRSTHIHSPGWDHPRTCGEQLCPAPPYPALLGSPPHMRGTAFSGILICIPFRITPAHAGNRQRLQTRRVRHQDHPRTCGEQPSALVGYHHRKGSPPHMRGTVIACNIFLLIPRITPAHAGNRAVISRNASKIWDHPRTCGEQLCAEGS